MSFLFFNILLKLNNVLMRMDRTGNHIIINIYKNDKYTYPLNQQYLLEMHITDILHIYKMVCE